MWWTRNWERLPLMKDQPNKYNAYVLHFKLSVKCVFRLLAGKFFEGCRPEMGSHLEMRTLGAEDRGPGRESRKLWRL